MNVVIDGVVYGLQRHGGINTLFNEVLPRLARNAGVQVDLLLPRDCLGVAPRLPVRRLRRDLLCGNTHVSWKLDNIVIKWINKTALNLRIRSRRDCIFQSTYFTSVAKEVPQVGIVYDLNHEKFPELYNPEWVNPLRVQYRDYLRRSDRIIAISRATKQDVVKCYGISPDLIDTVHLAVDRCLFSPKSKQSNLPPGLFPTSDIPPYVFFVGMRTGYKNFARLLNAFKLCDFGTKGYLVAAGSPMTEEERKTICSLGLEDRVRFVVQPTTTELSALYNFSQGFIYPSLGEGFGVPMLEAMASGAPTLLSDIPVFREVAEEACLYFDPYDCHAIARGLDSLLSPDICKRLSELGLRQVEKYSWDTCAAQVLETYRRVLSGN